MKTKKLIVVAAVLCISTVLFAGCKSSTTRTYMHSKEHFLTLDKGDTEKKGTGKATKVWLPVDSQEILYTGKFEYNNNKLIIKDNFATIAKGEVFSRSDFKINYNASKITICSRDYNLK